MDMSRPGMAAILAATSWVLGKSDQDETVEKQSSLDRVALVPINNKQIVKLSCRLTRDCQGATSGTRGAFRSFPGF